MFSDASILWMIGGFILVLSPIIIIHELGHFWAARAFGIKVEEFGLGFPPRAVTLFERKGTKYSLNWIPLGGFVRPAGEDDPTIPGGLASASKTARLVTLAAGAFMNFVLAFFILWGVFIYGSAERAIMVTEVTPGLPAAIAGLQPDDVIVALDGEPVFNSVGMLTWNISDHIDQETIITVERAGERVTMPITAQLDPDNPSRGLIGITHNYELTGERNSFPIGEAATESVRWIWEVISLTLRAPGMVISGEMSPQDARPVSVVGISQIVGTQAQEASQSGDWFNVLFFAGIVSVGLGFTNLLPLPALDGGRILFVLLEALRGKRISPEREGFVHAMGMLLLLSLMAVLIANDLLNPII